MATALTLAVLLCIAATSSSTESPRQPLASPSISSKSYSDNNSWHVVEGIDAVGYVTAHTKLFGPAKTLEVCEALCESDRDVLCNIFTWNSKVAPYNCFGGVDASAQWVNRKNKHCISGCRGAACTPAPPAPAPPPPPPPPTPPAGYPHWTAPRPSVKLNASAGLRPVPGVTHTTVYNATSPSGERNQFGVYNHGPMATLYNKTIYMSWYNAPVGEKYGKRSVYATSQDGGHTWGSPGVLFPPFTQQPCPACGEENGPWTTLGAEADGTGGRLYTQSGTQDAGEHHEGIISVARRVGINGNPAALGPPFWLNRTVPAYCTNSSAEECKYPTYLEMDAVTRADAAQLLASFVRTLVVYPDESTDAKKIKTAEGTEEERKQTDSPRRQLQHLNVGDDDMHSSGMHYNERSLYAVPGTRDLVLLLRGYPHALSAALCTLPASPYGTAPFTAVSRSCRSGVGDAFMNLVELVNLGSANSGGKPRICNWTSPIPTDMPDSGSRTCAAPLPDGKGIYLVGNQIDRGRDPVTIATSHDGLTWDNAWAVRYGAPPVRYPGEAKGPGFQYPGALLLQPSDLLGEEGGAVEESTLIVCYSVGKEDIALTRVPLSAITVP